MSRQEVIEMINELSDDQLQQIANYIKMLLSEKDSQTQLDREQQELLELLNYTIESGRGDFAENHDHYLYGIPK